VNAESNEALCGLINGMGVEQFRRSMADQCFADQVLEHWALCSSHTGPVAKEKFEIVVEILVSQEGIPAWKDTQWRRDIVAAQMKESLAAIGIVAR